MADDVMAPATRMRRRSRLFKLVNVPMRALLRLPFRTPLSSNLMLVHHIGRRTGRLYRQPVSYVRDGGTLLTPGGGSWKRNLREGEAVTVRLNGRDVSATPELVRDRAEVEVLLGRMLARNPRLASFVPFVSRDGTVDPTKLESALHYGFCVVRWRLEGGAS